MNIMNSIPAICSDLTIREIEDEIIILSQQREEIHNLEGTAAFLWKAVDGQSSVAKICDKLCSEYDVTRDIAQADVTAFIGECVDKQLITLQ